MTYPDDLTHGDDCAGLCPTPAHCRTLHSCFVCVDIDPADDEEIEGLTDTSRAFDPSIIHALLGRGMPQAAIASYGYAHPEDDRWSNYVDGLEADIAEHAGISWSRATETYIPADT